jgi:hypothetical protein
MPDLDEIKQGEQGARDRRGRFAKRRSGNPAGRPRGSSNRATRAAEMSLDGEATALTRKAVELRLTGDQAALRLCLDRTVAPRRERATSQQPASPGSKSRAAALQDCRTGPWRTARAGPAPPVSPVLSGRDQASLHLVRSPGTAIGASCTA